MATCVLCCMYEVEDAEYIIVLLRWGICKGEEEIVESVGGRLCGLGGDGRGGKVDWGEGV